MIAVAALTVGLAANAASIQWGGKVANDARGDETAQEGAVYNAIFVGANDYSAMLSSLTYDTYTGMVGTGLGAEFVAVDGKILGNHTLTADDATAYQFMDSAAQADADGGVNGNWLITMYDETSPDKFWVGQYAVSGVTDQTTAGSIFDDTWNIGYGMQEGVTNSNVPEPTSGLLLLLGVAGLALKRRRA